MSATLVLSKIVRITDLSDKMKFFLLDDLWLFDGIGTLRFDRHRSPPNALYKMAEGGNEEAKKIIEAYEKGPIELSLEY